MPLYSSCIQSHPDSDAAKFARLRTLDIITITANL